MSAAENAPEEENKRELFPDNSPEQQPVVRRSGFAAPGFYDTIGPNGVTRREEKSQQAKRMYAEGRFGGRQVGAGRPRKNKSVAEVVTENADAATISRELNSMVKNKSPAIQLGAIDRINKFEQDLEKNMRDDEKELRKLSGSSLDVALKEVLAEHGVGYDYDLPDSEIEEDE